MATNDRILLDGILDERIAAGVPSTARDEVFEFLVFEQLLKFADLSADDIRSGWVDARDDGGLDGFFLFVNDHLLCDLKTFPWPRGKASIAVWLISCKHHDTFKQATVDKVLATLCELLDFSKQSGTLVGAYSSEVLSAREKVITAYKTLATRIDEFRIRVAYVSRGDTGALGESVVARARQTEAAVRSLFGEVDVQFQFVGASELIAMTRTTRRFSLELPFTAHFAQGERYVLLCRLEDYCRFVTDEDGSLRRYLFDSNVRDFVGLNAVNDEIRASLQMSDGPDFWWLNNGITILTTKAIITGNAIVLDDVQIVNGLQTTESIARHFRARQSEPDQRSVLVKVVKTDDPAVRDAIIRATNTQTAVTQQSLHATDKIQRDIEAILLRDNWYYDRRTNYYANQGIPSDRIVSPLYLAAGAVGLLLRAPRRASKLRQKFMRTQESYGKVFSEKHDLAMWPKLVLVLKFIDRELGRIRGQRGGIIQDRFLKRWRYVVGLIVLARLFGRFSFGAKEVATLDPGLLASDLVDDVWRIIERQSDGLKVSSGRALTAGVVRAICTDAAAEYALSDIKALRSGGEFNENAPRDSPSEQFLDEVDRDSTEATLETKHPQVGGGSARVLRSRRSFCCS